MIRGAETLAHYRQREEAHDVPKPQFGDMEREMGEEWEDAGPELAQPARVKMQELSQRRYAAEGAPDAERLGGWVR